MRRTVLALPLVLSTLVLATALPPRAAAADPSDSAAPGTTGARAAIPLTVGARIGGYGFRRAGAVDEHGHVAWDDCRMNGLGVFARRPLARLFVEAGADLYFAESFPMQPVPGEEMDRLSGLLTVAIGADLVRTRWFAGHVQVGTGLELTRIAMPAADGSVARDQRALPLAFVGVGGELLLGARTAFGASLRAHVMGHFDHAEDWGAHDHTTALATGGSELDVSPEIAAQGQFYVSYRL